MRPMAAPVKVHIRTGDILYAATATNSLTKQRLERGQVMAVGGGGLPTWGSAGVTSGGTGQTSYTTGDILYASATNTLSKLPI